MHFSCLRGIRVANSSWFYLLVMCTEVQQRCRRWRYSWYDPLCFTASIALFLNCFISVFWGWQACDSALFPIPWAGWWASGFTSTPCFATRVLLKGPFHVDLTYVLSARNFIQCTSTLWIILTIISSVARFYIGAFVFYVEMELHLRLQIDWIFIVHGIYHSSGSLSDAEVRHFYIFWWGLLYCEGYALEGYTFGSSTVRSELLVIKIPGWNIDADGVYGSCSLFPFSWALRGYSLNCFEPLFRLLEDYSDSFWAEMAVGSSTGNVTCTLGSFVWKLWEKVSVSSTLPCALSVTIGSECTGTDLCSGGKILEMRL